MKTKMKGKDFITLMDYSKEEIETIFELALDFKKRISVGDNSIDLLKKKTLGMLFLEASTRTRISFETAMTQLGGHAQYYSPEQLQLKNKESWVDTAKVMDRYIDGVLIRWYGEKGSYGSGRDVLDTFAANADIPVVNAGDDKEHPCQILTDILTMKEKFGPTFAEKKVVLSWVYAPRVKNRGIAQCMAVAAATLGMNLTFAFPPGYEIDPAYMEWAISAAKKSGGKIEIKRDLNEAVTGAHVVYAKSFGSYTLTPEEDMVKRQNLKHWIISPEHFERADPHAVFMHALPIDRNLEARDEIIDGPHSIIYDEAENRLHIQKAILSLIMAGGM
jgi:ornithine carbamoyltransferase